MELFSPQSSPNLQTPQLMCQEAWPCHPAPGQTCFSGQHLPGCCFLFLAKSHSSSSRNQYFPGHWRGCSGNQSFIKSLFLFGKYQRFYTLCWAPELALVGSPECPLGAGVVSLSRPPEGEHTVLAPGWALGHLAPGNMPWNVLSSMICSNLSPSQELKAPSGPRHMGVDS